MPTGLPCADAKGSATAAPGEMLKKGEKEPRIFKRVEGAETLRGAVESFPRSFRG